MNYGLKVLLKEPFHYLTSKNGRKFIKLCIQYGDFTRQQRKQIQLFGGKFTFVDSWSFLWQYFEIFVKESYNFNSSNDAPLIIDCGGNIGMSVHYFKKMFPGSTVICFEADPQVYEVLSENCKSLSNVELINSAVWVHNDGIQMELDHSDGGHMSDTGTAIRSVRLAEILDMHDQVDLLKMDVEGAEFQIIHDCKDKLVKISHLFIELHTFEGQPQLISELLSILEQAGFRYYLEQAQEQKKPLSGNWKISTTGMDVQINLYAIRG